MDNSKFDDIFKQKLESYEDPIGPSAAELSRLTKDLPQVAASTVSWVSKAIVASNALLLVTSLFFIYRTFILEEELTFTRSELVELQRSGQQVILLDSVIYDSIRYITNRNIRTALYQERDSLRGLIASLRSSNQSRAAVSNPARSEEELQALMAGAVEDFIASLQQDPELLAAILGQEGEEPVEIVIDEKPASLSYSERLQQLSEEASEKNLVEKILINAAKDSASSGMVRSILLGTDPDIAEDDQMTNSLTTKSSVELVAEMSDDEKASAFESLVAADPSLVSDAASEAGADDEFITAIDEISPRRIRIEIPRERPSRDSLNRVEQDPETVRDQQRRLRNRSWWLSMGLGAGLTPLNEAGTPRGTIISGLIERKLSERVGLASGIEYQSLEGETYDVENVDFGPFRDIPAGYLDDVKEVKVNLKWLDIPFEGRFYLLPGRKINPFVAASIRARLLVSQSYKLESNSSDDLLPAFDAGNTFSIPGVGVSAGSLIEFSPRVNGGVRLQQTIGGSNLGPYDNKLNSLSGQALLIFRLDR